MLRDNLKRTYKNKRGVLIGNRSLREIVDEGHNIVDKLGDHILLFKDDVYIVMNPDSTH